MTRYQKVLLVLILLLCVIYATTDIEKALILNEPAIVNVIVEIKSTLTIEKEILPDLKELVSRSYVFSTSKSIDGAIISADGYILTNSKIIENTTIINETILFASPLIAGDAGKIDHLKKYGQEIGDKEASAYEEYLFEIYGGASGFNKKISMDYDGSAVSINIEKKDVYVKLSDSTKPIKAQLIDTKNDMALLKIDKNNLPVVELKNTTMQSGDQVYIINTISNKTESDLIKGNDGSYDLLKNTKDEENNINIVTNNEGTPLALELGNELITKENIADLLKENNITEKESLTNAEFQEALDSYESGNYTRTKQKLETTLTFYPEHEAAKELLKKLEVKKPVSNGLNEWVANIKIFFKNILNKIPNEAKTIGLILLIMMLSIYVASKLRKKSRK